MKEIDYKPKDENALEKAELLLSEIFSSCENHTPMPADVITRENERSIQLLLWHLGKLSEMHKQALDSILKAECQVLTDLERLRFISSSFIHPADPRGSQLKDRLAMIEEKRERLEMDFFDRRCRCLEKLVTLVSRQHILTPPQYP